MKIQEFEILGPKLLTPERLSDERGYFTELFKTSSFESILGSKPFIQDNFSHSKSHVLRGLHCQTSPAQAKLVTCLSGKIYDVAVDIRRGSKTFGQYVSTYLDSELKQWFYVPEGFAHGFCVVGDSSADVLYKLSASWNQSSEITLMWNDPKMGIRWPIENPILSKKDMHGLLWPQFLLTTF